MLLYSNTNIRIILVLLPQHVDGMHSSVKVYYNNAFLQVLFILHMTIFDTVFLIYKINATMFYRLCKTTKLELCVDDNWDELGFSEEELAAWNPASKVRMMKNGKQKMKKV